MARTRWVIGLALVASALLATALWLGERRQPTSDALLGGPVVPGLLDRLDTLEEVRVSAAGPETLVTLRREDDTWRVVERDGWPADVGQLRAWLLGLGQARQLEAKTALEKNYAQLGVAGLEHADSRGVRVDLSASGWSAALIIGHNNPNGRGSFVRHPDEAQSWLADSDLAIERDPARWLARSLVSIPESELVAVELARPDGGQRLERVDGEESESSWRLAPLPDGRQADETALYGVAGFLDGLRLEDVRRAPAPEDEPELVATFLRQDGLRVEVRLWPDTGEVAETVAMPWAQLRVDVDAEVSEAFHASELARDERALAAAKAPAPGEDAGTASPGQDEQAAAAADAGSEAAGDDQAEAVAPTGPRDLASRLAATGEEAEQLQARVEGWLFKLPAFKLANLRRPAEDLLQPAD